VLEFGDIRIDLLGRVVERAGQTLRLTPIEYKLLTHLAAQPDRVITHRQLLKAVWARATLKTPTTCGCTWPTCAKRSSRCQRCPGIC